MKTQTTRQTVEVKTDAEGIVSHAGARLLAELADLVEFTTALSEAMAPTRARRSAHDPGVVLRDLIVAIADGGDCVTDLGVLADQEALFGSVASERTAHRVIKSVEGELLEAIRSARAAVRERAWDAGARPETITLGIDATLLGAASEKQGAAGNYKGGFGFHPLLCYLDETGEPLAGAAAPRQRRGQHRLRSLRGLADGARAAARRRPGPRDPRAHRHRRENPRLHLRLP